MTCRIMFQEIEMRGFCGGKRARVGALTVSVMLNRAY